VSELYSAVLVYRGITRNQHGRQLKIRGRTFARMTSFGGTRRFGLLVPWHNRAKCQCFQVCFANIQALLRFKQFYCFVKSSK